MRTQEVGKGGLHPPVMSRTWRARRAWGQAMTGAAISDHASIYMRRITNVKGDLKKGRACRCRLKPAVPGA
jgi:hypothetical protein